MVKDLFKFRNNMKKNTSFLLCVAILFLSSCKFVFFVKKDRVIQSEKGFVIFSNEGDFFIPSFVDTLKGVKDDFLSRKLYEKGFRISVNIYERANLLKIYADTLSKNKFILPVELNYLEEYNLPKKVNKNSEKYYSYPYIENGKVIVDCKVNNMNNKIIEIFPYLSESRIQTLENYIEK